MEPKEVYIVVYYDIQGRTRFWGFSTMKKAEVYAKSFVANLNDHSKWEKTINNKLFPYWSNFQNQYVKIVQVSMDSESACQ